MEFTIEQLFAVRALSQLIVKEGVDRSTRFLLFENLRTIEGILEDAQADMSEIEEKYIRRDKEGRPVISEGSVEIEDPYGYKREMTDLYTAKVKVNLHPITADHIEEAFDKVTTEYMDLLLKAGDYFKWNFTHTPDEEESE